MIIPTFYAQGFDLTVAEALARRRPVIVSNTGSYGVERDRYDWFYSFRLGDVGELERIVRHLADNVPPEPPQEIWGSGLHRPEVHARQWIWAIG